MIDKYNCKVAALEIINEYHRDGGCFSNELLDFPASELMKIIAKYAGSDSHEIYLEVKRILHKWWDGYVSRWGLPVCSHCNMEGK